MLLHGHNGIVVLYGWKNVIHYVPSCATCCHSHGKDTARLLQHHGASIHDLTPLKYLTLGGVDVDQPKSEICIAERM